MNRRLFVRMAKAALVVCFLALFVSSAAAQYSAVTLVSNTSVLTPIHMDANLVNGWGLVSSPTSPFWWRIRTPVKAHFTCPTVPSFHS